MGAVEHTRSWTASSRWLWVGLGGALAFSCIGRGEGEPPRKLTDVDASLPPPLMVEAGVVEDARYELPPVEPHAVQGIHPTHGPFKGGQLALVRGNGFRSDVRVWVGGVEVPSADTTPIDPARVQILIPPGRVGPADVSTQNGDDTSTHRSLKDGYVYDAFYLEPRTGPTSGGTEVTLHGQAAAWDGAAEVLIDGTPCTNVTLDSESRLRCTTPPGTLGSKLVRLRDSSGQSTDVLDAFTYADSDNGFRGGLSGEPLNNRLKVLVLNSFTGATLPGAWVILDDGTNPAWVQATRSGGVALFESPDLGPHRNVTVAKSCYQPSTFAAVPVDTLTLYLDPVMSTSCADGGDPPPAGGNPAAKSQVQGELVWPLDGEFRRNDWGNVPAPASEEERKVAYIFELARSPTQSFRISNATAQVTPTESGVSHSFEHTGNPGNLTLYALAGIENTQTKTFTAYAMGLARGISLDPDAPTTDIFIEIGIDLSQALSIEAPGPSPTSRGPDRMSASAAVRIGELGYALFPQGKEERLLPNSEPFYFIGLPSLGGPLLGSTYVATAHAYTGPQESSPKSHVGFFATHNAAQVIQVDRFVEVPVVTSPDANGAWDARKLSYTWAPGGAQVDLTFIEIDSGSGLIQWEIVAPGNIQELNLPDLRAIDAEAALIPGPLVLSVSSAQIPGFDYASFRYRYLSQNAWRAYAHNVFYAHY